MKHFIYKTTNLMNGKFYIGAHSTKNINDDYLGSGKRLKRAIKKYGKENFKREIVLFCDNENELYETEQKIIAEFIGSENCYNMNTGGKGGWFSVNASGINRGENNIMNRCAETKRRNIENAKKTRRKNPEFYAEIARTNGRKAIEKCKGVKRPHVSEQSRIVATKLWKENYEKMRDILSSYFEITSSSGEVFETNRLEDFCKERGLPYTSIWKTSRTNKPVSKGRAKGWICKKIFHN